MGLAIALFVMLMASPLLGLVNAQNPITWTLGKDYTSYSTQSFKSGSTLEFDYDKSSHNVLVVSKSDYDSCNAKNPIQTFADGKSVIPLKQGAMYFICGFPTHCQNGMKLQVNVGESGGSTPATPATPPATPTPSGSGSTPATPAAESPKDSSAAGGLSGAGHLMVGVSLVFGAFFALV